MSTTNLPSASIQGLLRTALYVVVQITLTTISIPLVIAMTFPFVLYQVVRFALGPTPTAALALGISLIAAFILTVLCLNWYGRRVSLHVLHDGLYATRGCAVEEYTFDDYVSDSNARQWFYHPLDCARPPQRRANRIRVLWVRRVRNRLIGGQRPPSDPITYSTGIGFGYSYIIMKDKPGFARDAGHWIIAHEFAHARHNFTPTLFNARVLRAAPYALTLIWIAFQTSWSWPVVCCFAALIYMMVNIPRWAKRFEPQVHLYREIDADRIALLACDDKSVESLARMLFKDPLFLADDLLPEQYRTLRRSVLAENIVRRQKGQALVMMPEFGYLPRLPAYSFRLLTIVLAVLAGSLSSVTPSIILAIGVIGPLLLLILLTLRGYHRVTEQINTFIKTSQSRATAAEAVEQIIREQGLPVAAARIPENRPPDAVIRTGLRYNYDSLEGMPSELLDLLATGPARTGLRVSLLVNRPLDVARREIEGIVWSASKEERELLDNALRRSLVMPIHTKPQRIPQLADLYGFFKLVVAYRERSAFSFKDVVDNGYPTASTSVTDQLVQRLSELAALDASNQPEMLIWMIIDLFGTRVMEQRDIAWQTLINLALLAPDEEQRRQYRDLIREILLVLRRLPDGVELMYSAH